MNRLQKRNKGRYVNYFFFFENQNMTFMFISYSLMLDAI